MDSLDSAHIGRAQRTTQSELSQLPSVRLSFTRSLAASRSINSADELNLVDLAEPGKEDFAIVAEAFAMFIFFDGTNLARQTFPVQTPAARTLHVTTAAVTVVDSASARSRVGSVPCLVGGGTVSTHGGGSFTEPRNSSCSTNRPRDTIDASSPPTVRTLPWLSSPPRAGNFRKIILPQTLALNGCNRSVWPAAVWQR